MVAGPTRHGLSHGFTLIEIMLAVAILGGRSW